MISKTHDTMHTRSALVTIASTAMLLALLPPGCSTAPPADDETTEPVQQDHEVELTDDRAGWSEQLDVVDPVLDRIPRDAEHIAFAASIAEFLALFAEADETAEQRGALDDVEDRFHGDRFVEYFGMDPTDPAHWHGTGVDLEAPVVAAGLDGETLLCAPVRSRDDFEQFITGPLAMFFHADAEQQRQQTVGEHTIYTAGDQLAWSYLEEIGCVAEAGEDAADVLAEFLEGSPAVGSLSTEPGFEQFRDSRLADRPGAVYSRQEFRRPFAGIPHPGIEEALQAGAVGWGAAFDYADETFQLEYWAGLDDSQLEQARRGLTGQPPVQFGELVDDELLAALRLSMDEHSWEGHRTRLVEVLPMIRQMQHRIDEQAGDQLDLQRDLVDHLGGHAGLFVYAAEDFERNLTALLHRGAGVDGEEIEALLLAELTSEQVAEEFLEKLVGAWDELADVDDHEVRDVDGTGGAVEVVESSEFDFRLYRFEAVVVAATDALSPERVGQMLIGDGSDTADLGEMARPVGENHFTGFYLTGEAWWIAEGLQGWGRGGLQRMLDEATGTADYDDTGVILALTLHPAAEFLVTQIQERLERFPLEHKATGVHEVLERVQSRAVAHYEEHSEREEPTFPGGEHIRVRTSERVPEAGETVEPDPVVEGDTDVDPEELLEQLGVLLDEPLYFRITYETGAGFPPRDVRPYDHGPATGDDARAVVRAEANFDPATPEYHTTQGVVVVLEGQPEAFPTVWTR